MQLLFSAMVNYVTLLCVSQQQASLYFYTMFYCTELMAIQTTIIFLHNLSRTYITILLLLCLYLGSNTATPSQSSSLLLVRFSLTTSLSLFGGLSGKCFKGNVMGRI